MLRRQMRNRREYIYRKTIENREQTIAEKKKLVKASLNENKALPTSMKDDAISISKKLPWDDGGGEGVTTHADDEYKWAGEKDPKIIITTSHNPSSKLRQFAKEVRLLFPNAQRINRGKHDEKHLMNACRAHGVTDLIVLNETRGVPDGMTVCHLPYGPTAYFTLANVKMRHDMPDLPTMSEEWPHLIFHNFNSKIGHRVRDILKYLFPPPKEDSKRVMTFMVGTEDDYIEFRHHTFKEAKKVVELMEEGPRFDLKVYKIILGTLDTVDSSDIEWVYRPFMNTAKKKRIL